MAVKHTKGEAVGHVVEALVSCEAGKITFSYVVVCSGGAAGIGETLRAVARGAISASAVNRMESYIGPMAQWDADAAPGDMSQGDLETARLYGARVAQVARRLAVGMVA